MITFRKHGLYELINGIPAGTSSLWGMEPLTHVSMADGSSLRKKKKGTGG